MSVMVKKAFDDIMAGVNDAVAYARGDRGRARTLDDLIDDLPPAERAATECRTDELHQLALARRVARRRRGVLRRLAE